MALTIKPLHAFGAEVSGVDMARPLDPAIQAEIVAAMDRHGVCVFRNTGLTDEGHVAFSRIFGELMLAPRMADRKPRMPLPELFDAGNLDDQGNINDNEMLRLHKRATGSGTPTPPSCRRARPTPCCWPTKSRPTARATPSSPTCARPTRPCPRRRRTASRA